MINTKEHTSKLRCVRYVAVSGSNNLHLSNLQDLKLGLCSAVDMNYQRDSIYHCRQTSVINHFKKFRANTCTIVLQHKVTRTQQNNLQYNAVPHLQGEHKVFPCLQTFIYLDMLDLYVAPQLEEFQPWIIFQQNDAPPHWGSHVPRFLDATFPNRWNGRDGPTPWPPRSPDITTP